MARDFEDLHDIDDLNDDELRQLVRSHLDGERGLDADDITVVVEDGVVALAGRIGTEAEMRIAEHVVTDVLGIEQFENQLVVDPIRRGTSPEDIDEHLADEAERAGKLLGDRPVPMSPEVEQVQESLDDRLYGTTDVQDAIAEGTAWNPPDSPTPEGRDVSGDR
ncbi:MAG: BON domain-containing protein [Gemmatimonadaceae bacterium]|nr:BON domain-containing protein [Gemmatimonadaceae bacterium]